MANPSEQSKSRLIVEGKDDKFAVLRLLEQHGFVWEDGAPFIYVADDKKKLIKGIPAAVKTFDRLGVVVDADAAAEATWQAVGDRAREAGVNLPENADGSGTVTFGASGRRFGVWLMPDNRGQGVLEDFLATLVPEGDACWPYAGEVTIEAQRRGARLPPRDLPKGRIYTWLAWQEEPGLPFGTALTATVLGHDSVLAQAFVAWFHRLFS